LVFGKGYASQRNIVLYTALKNHIDCLLYLDDDEYPVAVMNNMGSVSWIGQHVLKTHLNYLTVRHHLRLSLWLHFADPDILNSGEVFEVEEVNHAKFISGSNLCLHLKDPSRLFPFYNPPGARGEDTFLSTCLSDRKVLKVPLYAFHNAFSTYNHVLMGVLPTVSDQ